MNNSKSNILFLCTGNSCRSQIAEGWLRELKEESFNAYSAGIETHGMNPYAIKVMEEVGVDISKQHSKLVDELNDVEFDFIISVCSHADQTCPPFFRSGKKIFFGFDDPPKLAKHLTVEEEILDCYRSVRDEIKTFITDIEQHLNKS